MLDKLWDPGITLSQQPCYQPVQYCTYWTMLGYFNKWIIITFSNKTTKGEEFEEFHQVIIDGINDNMASLVQPN